LAEIRRRGVKVKTLADSFFLTICDLKVSAENFAQFFGELYIGSQCAQFVFNRPFKKWRFAIFCPVLRKWVSTKKRQTIFRQKIIHSSD
jgi:hypothetical protein